MKDKTSEEWKRLSRELVVIECSFMLRPVQIPLRNLQ